MYPSIMFSVAITVSIFMLIKVVPVFAKMYDGMGIELPAAAGSSIPIPSYILANTGTTFISMKILTVIATENMMLGYIKADLLLFLIASFFSRDSTILSRKTSNLPLASPALIKLI